MLNIVDSIPDGLLQLEAAQLHTLLPGPTLIHLPGRARAPLFVSVLLHGNETGGWIAVRDMLQSFQDADKELPRALSLFIGNVFAAREGRRRLMDQLDYNRIWTPGDSPEHFMARQLLDEMRGRGVFAAIDLHNNTGHNPHYACINDLRAEFLRLARVFGRTVVYFRKPDSVLSMAFAELCPTTTVECGRVGESAGITHAREFVQSVLNLSDLSAEPTAYADVDLYHTVAIVKIPANVRIGFENEVENRAVDVRFVANLDRYNFKELPANTDWGSISGSRHLPVTARNEAGLDVTEKYFSCRDNRIQTKLPVMPAMLTLDRRIIRQDCLCYLMERYPLPERN